MKRIAAVALIAGAMGVVPAVASAGTSPSPAVMNPVTMNPAVARTAVVNPMLVRWLIANRAIARPLPMWPLSLRVTTLSRLHTVAR